jgi:hypothetical protein
MCYFCFRIFKHIRMKKNIVLAVLVLSFALNVSAQNFRIQAPPGYNYIYSENNVVKGTEGSPFMGDWQKADVYFTNGTAIKDLEVRYNVFSNQILYKEKDKIYLIGAPDSILELKFPDKTMIYKEYTLQQKTLKSFFEVIQSGKATLLNKYEIEVTPANYNEALMSGNKNDVLNLVQKLYILKGNTIVPLKKKATILELLGDKKSEITSFMAKEKLSIKKKKDMATLLAFYNQL